MSHSSTVASLCEEPSCRTPLTLGCNHHPRHTPYNVPCEFGGGTCTWHDECQEVFAREHGHTGTPDTCSHWYCRGVRNLIDVHNAVPT